MRSHCLNQVAFIVFAASMYLCSQSGTRLVAEDVLVSSSGYKPPAEPAIAAASNEGQQQIGSFKKPADWTCRLFAAEPIVANPVALGIDRFGHVFVCETYRQGLGVTDNRGHDNTWLMADLASQTVEDRIAYHRELLKEEAVKYEEHDDRIRRLVDTDGDGVADDSTVFVSGFNRIEEGTGASVLAHDGAVYYTNIPKLWKFQDKDNDGVADERIVLSDGYGVRVAFRGHDMHGLVVGPDGMIYYSIGDRGYNVQTPNGLLHNVESGAVFRCEPDGSGIEVFATGMRNPQDLAFDDFGNMFTGDNNSDSGDKARWVYVAHGGDSGWRMTYQYLPDRGPFNREKIWYPFSEDSPVYTVPPIANLGDGPSGLTYYPGTGMGSDLNKTFLLCDFRGQASNSGIRSFKSVPKGAFFEISDSKELVWNMLATDADFGPDGSLYVTDWVNGWNGEGKGRVYRFIDQDEKVQVVARETKKVLASDFATKTEDNLVRLLSHADRRIRFQSQFELARRSKFSILADVAKSQSKLEARLHAVWGLGQIARVGGSEAKMGALHSILDVEESVSDDASDEVRVSCIRVLGDNFKSIETIAKDFNTFGSKIADGARLLFKQSMGTGSPRVKAAAGIAAYQHKVPGLVAVASKLLVDNADQDPIVRHAGIMALAGGSTPTEIAALKDNSSVSVRVAAAVALRKLNAPEIKEFLSDSDSKIVLEAARAINDVEELHSELPALAALIGTKAYSDPITHRILNANFRLGYSSNADALAKFAADSQNGEAMRIEALSMLQTWAEPGKLDRIVNRFDPLEPRDAEIAKTALQPFVTRFLGEKGKVAAFAKDVGADLGIESFADSLMASVLDTKEDATVRASAIKGLVKLVGDKGLTMMTSLIDDPSPLVRSAVLESLVKLKSNKAVDAADRFVLSDIESERQSAWDAVANIHSDAVAKTIERGLQQYLDGSMPADCRLNFREAINDRLDNPSQEKLAVIDKAQSENERQDPSGSYLDCVVGGDVDKGNKLFQYRTQLSCVRCHKVGVKGGEVGPNLTEIGSKKDAKYLLEAIVAPNAKLAEGYETLIVQTDDGQVLSGIMKSEDDDMLRLLSADGVIIEVEKDSIIGTKKGQSSMPLDLMKSLTKRELRDLVAYLVSLKSDPTKATKDDKHE